MNIRICSLITLACACGTASADVLLIDAGGITAASDADRLNSPYHAVNASFTDTDWNAQGKNNDSTLIWSDGSTATGVSLTTLKGSAGSTSLAEAGWSANTSDLNGSAVNTGVYADGSVGVDGWMMTSTFTDHRPIGVQISGLAAGTYDIYLTGRNTNYIAAAYTQNFYVGAGATEGSFDFASYANEATTFAASATDKVSAWQFVSGDASNSNYVRLTATLDAANPYLNIGTVGADTNGIFSSIEIVPVPEPSSLALLVGIGCASRCVVRRREAPRNA